jgi:hypothetical protein
MQPPTPSRDRFIANRSAIDLDVARYALDSSTNGNNATNGDGSGASQPDSLLIASPSKVWGKFLDMDFFLSCFTFVLLSSSAISIFSSFLRRNSLFSFASFPWCGREAFRSLLLLLLHKVIFSIGERFVIGFRGKVLSANEKKMGSHIPHKKKLKKEYVKTDVNPNHSF